MNESFERAPSYSKKSQRGSVGGKGIHSKMVGAEALMGAPRPWKPLPVKPVLGQKRRVRVPPIPAKPRMCWRCMEMLHSTRAWGQHGVIGCAEGAD